MTAMSETKKAAIMTWMVLVPTFVAATVWASQWSRFRGSNGTGVADTTGLPAEFGPEENVIWKTALPPGPSSPILSDDRIFLTAYEGQKLWTLGLDRLTGRILWRREAPREREEKIDDRNSPASPSPVTDGKSVYVFFPEYGLIAYDVQGNEMWRYPLGPFNNTYGMGASPILADDKVLLVCDQQTDSFVIALGKEDGRLHWKADRPEAKSGHSTPILYHPEEGATQLIVPGSFLLTAY
jgi:outer membrane protein assembly factor BamB